MKRIFIFIIAVFSLNLFAKDLKITDLVGREVFVPKSPKRIICLAPGTLRLISYLNATGLVVGVEAFEKRREKGRPYWLANREMKKLPAVASGGAPSINKIPDLENILKVKPDLIFITLLQKHKADQFQKKIGVPVVVLSYGRFASFDKVIFKSLTLAGKILKKEKRAKEVINFIKEKELDLKQRGGSSKFKSYVGGIGFRGGHGIESSDSSYIPFEWLGVNNIAKKVQQSGHLFLNKEMLLALNPEYIFIDGGGKSLVLSDYRRKKTFYNSLRAFKNKKVFNLWPFNFYTTNIGSALINAYAIGKILYPSKFKDIELNQLGGKIYSLLLGKDILSVMEQDYGKLKRLVL
jgi:iron complex transport system substrate-binding protein